MSRFKSAAKSIRGSPFVVPLTAVFIILFIISLVIIWEDIQTSRLGYELLPTRKSNRAVIWAVALIPTFGQIGFIYAFFGSNGGPWKLWVAFALHCIDVATDVIFKADGGDIIVWLVALVESEMIFTVGSELLLVVSVGMLFQLIPDAARQLGRLMLGENNE